MTEQKITTKVTTKVTTEETIEETTEGTNQTTDQKGPAVNQRLSQTKTDPKTNKEEVITKITDWNSKEKTTTLKRVSLILILSIIMCTLKEKRIWMSFMIKPKRKCQSITS